MGSARSSTIVSNKLFGVPKVATPAVTLAKDTLKTSFPLYTLSYILEMFIATEDFVVGILIVGNPAIAENDTSVAEVFK